MIIDTLDQRHKYAQYPNLYAALEALSTLDETTPPGTHINLNEVVGHIDVSEFTSVNPATN